MNKESIVKLLREKLSEFTEKYSVKRIGLFGSFANDTDSSESDVDILVELTEPTFDHYMDLKFRLEDLFGSQVDLVMAETLKPRIKPIIEKEVIYA